MVLPLLQLEGTTVVFTMLAMLSIIINPQNRVMN